MEIGAILGLKPKQLDDEAPLTRQVTTERSPVRSPEKDRATAAFGNEPGVNLET